MKNIEEIAKKCNLGDIKKIDTFKSSQNQVYKVKTNINTYVIKEYSFDAISNYYYLKKEKSKFESVKN